MGHKEKIKVAKKMLKVAKKFSKPHTKAYTKHKNVTRKVKKVKKQAEMEIQMAMEEISRKTILIKKYESQKHSVFAKQLKMSLKEHQADIAKAKKIIEHVEIHEKTIQAVGGEIDA